MRTRTCRSLLWAVVILMVGMSAGRASAIGPNLLLNLKCKWATPRGDPLFGYVATTWRPWPLSRSGQVISVPVVAVHPGQSKDATPATGAQTPPDMEKAR